MPKQKLEFASIFFGFTQGAIDALSMAERMLFLPQHVVEFALDHNKRVGRKMSGGTYHFLPLQTDALLGLPIGFEVPFWCLVSNEDTYQSVVEFIKSVEHPILHICTEKKPNSVFLNECDTQKIYDYCHLVVDYFRSRKSGGVIEYFNELPEGLIQGVNRSVSLKCLQHLVTLPNELVLESSGYSLAGDDKLEMSVNDLPYIQAVLNSAKAVIRERDQIEEEIRLPCPTPINLILSCPAFYHHVYRSDFSGFHGAKVLKLVVNSYRRQKNYYQKIPAEVLAGIETDEFKSIIGLYRREIGAFTQAVSIKASNHFVPVIRLPHAVNLIYSHLNDLAKCTRSESQRMLFKQEKLFRVISKALSDNVPKEYFDSIDKLGNKIKLICNAPLEWLPVRGLPLMLRYEVSRIPSTPGNSLLSLTGVSREMTVTPESFSDVLIVRAFEKCDPIRDVLVGTVNVTKEEIGENMKIRVEDVSTVDEFIRVVNSFEGMVLVFDGHGRASINDVGVVFIDGKPIDLYQYRSRLRVPPIVILSSCDTHAIDGTHASVANTFLMLGATTVLGTLLPVSALYSGVFTSRLLLRIGSYIPMFTKKSGKPIRWSTVVFGMQKMEYVTERVQSLLRSRGLNEMSNQHLVIQLEANQLILCEDPDWYEKTVQVIASQLSQSEDQTLQELSNHQFVDIVKYVQLGNPDQILIAAEPE